MKRILFIVIMAGLITGLLYYLFTRDKKEGNDFIKVSGNIETTEVDVGFKISGRIVSLLLQEGDAEAALHQAQFDLENKQAHYERMKVLFEGHVIPKETLGNAEAGYKIAKAAGQRATENFKLVKEGPRKEDIEDAKAQVEQARAFLKLAETQLSYTVLNSPLSGVVLVKSR